MGGHQKNKIFMKTGVVGSFWDIKPTGRGFAIIDRALLKDIETNVLNLVVLSLTSNKNTHLPYSIVCNERIGI